MSLLFEFDNLCLKSTFRCERYDHSILNHADLPQVLHVRQMTQYFTAHVIEMVVFGASRSIAVIYWPRIDSFEIECTAAET